MTDRAEARCAIANLRKRQVPVAALTLACFFYASLHPVVAWAERRLPTDHADAPIDPGPANIARKAPPSKPPSRRLQPHPGSAQNASSAPVGPSNVAQVPDGELPKFNPAALPKGDHGISAQSIALPSGAATVGGMGESFSAQLTTGIATMSVPFALPAARGGTQAALGLVYSSSGGYGLAGVGWSLVGEVYVVRQTDRGVPAYNDQSDWHPEQDRFLFGAHELVPICRVAIGGQCSGALTGEVMPGWADGWQYYRPRVEGAFLRFFWSPDHRTWRVQSKEGGVLELGVPLDGTGYTGALEANPSRPNEVYRWHLARQHDARGTVNSVIYRHTNDGGVVYLTDVFHTSPASAPTTVDLASYAHHARLSYAARADTTVSYRAGFAQEQRLRLSRVDVSSKPFANPLASDRELVRRYHLEYEANSHASLLRAVAMEGRCATSVAEASDGTLPPTSCPRLPPLSFEYQHVPGSTAPLLDGQGLAFEQFDETVHTLPNSPPHSLDESDTSLVDINADALPDVLVTAPGLFGGKHGLFLNGQAGAVGFSNAMGMGVSGVSTVDSGVLRLSNTNVSGLDLDGDARVDLVHMPMVKTYSVFTPSRSGNQWIWAGRPIATSSGQSPKIDFTNNAQRIAVMDVNVDGLVDVVFSSATEVQTFFALGRYPNGDGRFGSGAWTGPDTAALSDDPVSACTPWSASPVRIGDGDVRVADMNGDGLPDIVRARSGQILYWPGRGNGFWGTGERDDCKGGGFGQGRHVEMTNAPFTGVTQPGTLELADVNGDGLADLLEIRFNAVDVYLNDNGVRWTARTLLDKVPIKPNSGNPVRLTDVDGSGTIDLVWGHGYDYKYIDLAGGLRPHLLTRIDNGLGKTTELEYSTSTQLMLDAASAGTPWSSTMPLAIPVIVRSTERDNLDKIGRAPGVYVTEYAYRDPVFDGRQREFKGFSVAETRTPGDDNSPTAKTRSTFLLGECRAPQSGVDPCTPGDRWRDNWREPLKGLPVLVETFDEAGVYLSTAHTTYELRQLYTGRDGRRVSAAFAVQQESFGYDTAAFAATSQPELLDEVVVNLGDINQTDTRSVIVRASGAVKLKSRQLVDDFGNAFQQIADGCVAGCAAADEVITTHAVHVRPAGDTSGWLFRPVETYITGSVHAEPRHRAFFQYDSQGDLEQSSARLSGTLALDRFHENSGAIAPAPPNASGGIAAPIDVVLMEYERDIFGNVIGTRAALDRCRTIGFDVDYGALPVSETVHAGTPGPTGCGARELTTIGIFDRGLGMLVYMEGVTSQPAAVTYDGFGRLTAKRFADPSAPGQLAPLPAVTYEYLLPANPQTTPYSQVITRGQDGADASTSQYHERHAFVDGMGRSLATLHEADPTNGDGGDWVVGGITHFDKKGAMLRSYQRFFYSGDPTAFPLGVTPSTSFASQKYDAFGRTIAAYGLDGQMKVRTFHHALSRDVWDAEDLTPGAHQATFATAVADGHGRTVRTTERIRVSGVLEQRHLLRDYLPTGETFRVVQRRTGSPDTVRWMRYDSLGRLVLNVEPNTSVGFSPDPSTDPNTIRAWRYAYNDAGQLVGTSDARGCGVNYHFEAAGRVIAEDYSPCETNHAPYTPVTDLATGAGAEVFTHYDVADPESASIVDAGGKLFPFNANLLLGGLVSVSDRASKGILRYDALGRVTGTAVRIAQPVGATPGSPSSYAPRWYIQERSIDAANRTVDLTTGATVPELLGTGNLSKTTAAYTRRGMLASVASTYGLLLASQTYAADGLVTASAFGDLAGTQRAYTYDQQRRPRSVQTFRAAPALWTSPTYMPATDPTQQLLMEDYDITYDEVGNITEVTDWRVPADWPSGAKPVHRKFEYDDLYRITRAQYISSDASGADAWTSPFDAESTNPALQPQPAPHVGFADRAKDQHFAYDYLGNTIKTTDDSSGFFDRSLGDVQSTHHRLVSASNRTLAPSSPRKGDLSAEYDAAGNLIALIVRRDGTCLPTGASCWQRYAYGWNELGRLVEARRWDLAAGAERDDHGALTDPPPARTADVRLRYLYDAAGQRVLKTAIDPTDSESHTVYIFPTLELRRTWWTAQGQNPDDYALTPETESVLLPAARARARVVYSEANLPSEASGRQYIFMELSDHLGSTVFLIDRATSELVEHSAYMAYGGADSDYRPGRWASFREPYKFGGKEEDIEVGLQYFGARYLVVGLGRWASADPVTIHTFGSDPNPYAYVAGRPLVFVDPDGRELITAIAVGAAIGLLIAGGSAYYAESRAQGTGNFTKWQNKNQAWGRIGLAAGIGAVAGGVLGGFYYIMVPWLLGPSAGTTAASGGTTTVVSSSVAPGLVDATIMGTVVGASAGAIAGAGYGAFQGEGSQGVLDYSLRGTEAGALAGLGAGLGAGAGGVVGLAEVGAISGGLNGGIAGWRQIYDWTSWEGYVAFGSDSSWGLVGTTLGNGVNVYNIAAGADYNEGASHRQNRQVYNDGFRLKDGFAHTQGNVVSNFGNRGDDLMAHETEHIWTSRVGGPFYQGSYLGWMVVFGVVGSIDAGLSGENWGSTVQEWSYYDNPWEVLAYNRHNPGARDGHQGLGRGGWPSWY